MAEPHAGELVETIEADPFTHAKAPVKELVEELFGFRGRVRVLRVVSERGELNISDVARRSGMNHGYTERHLEKLVEMGLVREKRFGSVRIFEAAFKDLVVRFERGRGLSVEVDAL